MYEYLSVNKVMYSSVVMVNGNAAYEKARPSFSCNKSRGKPKPKPPSHGQPCGTAGLQLVAQNLKHQRNDAKYLPRNNELKIPGMRHCCLVDQSVVRSRLFSPSADAEE